MATISLSSAAPNEGPVRFSFATATFELSGGETYDTDDAALISDAAMNHLLKVTYPAGSHGSAEAAQAIVDASTDPHVNPKADHLSSEATPEVVAAAQKRADEIRAEAQPNTNVQVEPSVGQETVETANPAVPTPTVPVAVDASDPSTQEHTS